MKSKRNTPTRHDIVSTPQDHADNTEAYSTPAIQRPRSPIPQDESSLDHPEPKELAMQDVGAKDKDFFDDYMRHMWEANSRDGEVDVMDFRFALSFVEDVKPTSQAEAALALQMALSHLYAMRFAQRLSRANNISELEIYERIFTKMTRNYVAQMQALNANRNNNAPGVTVQNNFSVKGVGQAIVGNITHHAGGGVPETAAAPPPAVPRPTVSPMPHDPLQQPKRISACAAQRR
jgi:hypothetical protein